MLIQDLLANKGREAKTITADRSVETAIDMLAEENTRALIVTDNERPVGIFTERDVLRCHVRDRSRTFSEVGVGEAMTNKLIVAEPEETIETAMATMIQADIRHLPVVRGERIVGMLTITDLVRQHLGDLKAELHYLQDYISDLQDASRD